MNENLAEMADDQKSQSKPTREINAGVCFLNAAWPEMRETGRHYEL